LTRYGFVRAGEANEKLPARDSPFIGGSRGILIGVSGIASASNRSLSGVVQTGGTASRSPLANVNVTLFEATSADPSALGQATTDPAGRFTILYRQSSSSSIFYLVADVGGGVEFVTVLGANLPASATINELTTVAASYSMAQFYRTGVISGNPFGLQIAAEMNDNIVAIATGDPSPVLLGSPNADQTNSLRSTRALANLLAACIGDPDVTTTFFGLTTVLGGATPHNTAEALANLARDPARHVDAIYALTLLGKSYQPQVVATGCVDRHRQGQQHRQRRYRTLVRRGGQSCVRSTRVRLGNEQCHTRHAQLDDVRCRAQTRRHAGRRQEGHAPLAGYGWRLAGYGVRGDD
jgi:hypothetical protein